MTKILIHVVHTFFPTAEHSANMAGIPWPNLNWLLTLASYPQGNSNSHSFLVCCQSYLTAIPSLQFIIIAAIFFTHPPLPEVWPYSQNFLSQKPFNFWPHTVLINRVKSPLWMQTGLQLNLSTLFCRSTLFLFVLNTLQHALCIAFQAQWVFSPEGKRQIFPKNQWSTS